MSKGKIPINNKKSIGSEEIKSHPKEKHPLPDFLKGKEFYIAITLITLIAFFVFKDFLLFKKVMLYRDVGIDTLNASFPFLTHTADYIHSFGLPSWSFNYGMGQNLFPLFLRDPFDIVLYIIGKPNLAYGIGYIEFLKVVLGGLFFFLYLRTLEMKGFTCIVGALLFSFSGFMILGGTWYVFSSEAVIAALLLLAFEKLYKQNSWFLFPIAIAVIGMTMPFNLYVYGLFLIIYATVRFFEDKDKLELKGFLELLGKMFLYGLLGLAISSFFLFENILHLIESPRGSGEDSLFKTLSSAPVFETGNFVHNVTAILRIFSSDILGSGSNYKGWWNYLEAPVLYSGLLCLIVLPQAFPFFSKRQKIIYSFFLLIWILPIVFPYFRHAFWLFTGEYYRTFSFFTSFAFLFLTLKALNNIEIRSKINLPVIIGTTLFLSVILFFPYFKKGGNNPIDSQVMNFVRTILLIYILLIYLLSVKNTQLIAKILLILALCFELGYLSNLTVSRRLLVTTQELNKKIGYNDYSVDAIDFIKKRDAGFYRIDKNFGSSYKSLNDGLAQDYYGTSSYNPFNQKYYIRFLKALGIAKRGNETDTRWAQGLRGRTIRESIGTVKYFLAKKNAPNAQLDGAYDSIAQFGDVTVFKSNYFLPLGFTYDHFLTRSEFDKLSFDQKDLTMLNAFFINDDETKMYSGCTKFNLSDTMPVSNFTWDICRKDISELKKDSLNIIDKGQDFVNGTINLDKKKILFLSIPYDKGWKALVDGKEQDLKIVDAGMIGMILEKGKHTIELKFTPRFLKIGLIISLLSILLYVFLYRKTKRQS